MAYTTDPALDAMELEDLEQLILDAQAEVQRRANAERAAVSKVEAQAEVDKLTLATAQVTLEEDATDGEWVVIRLPIATEKDAAALRYWKLLREHLISDGQAKEVEGDDEAIRCRRMMAKQIAEKIEVDLGGTLPDKTP